LSFSQNSRPTIAMLAWMLLSPKRFEYSDRGSIRDKKRLASTSLTLIRLTDCSMSAHSNAPIDYAHAMGMPLRTFTVNTGADITLTKSMVSTTRFGYFFENYHTWFLDPRRRLGFWVSGEGQASTLPLPVLCQPIAGMAGKFEPIPAARKILRIIRRRAAMPTSIPVG